MYAINYKTLIVQALGFEPTADQQHAIDTFAEFLADRDDHVAMVLRGSAGTGKTTLSGAIVRTMLALKQRGIGVLLIEQKLTIAMNISDRVLVMGHGQIVFQGTPQQLRGEREGVRKDWLEV